MRLNKFKGLLIPLVCLSLVSCKEAELKETYNQDVHEEYKLFLASVNNSMYESSLKSVVSVLNLKDGDFSTLGSGFIYDQDENFQYVITNYHVIRDEDNHRIISSNGQVKKAEVLGYDEIFDVAVLKVGIMDESIKCKFPNEDYRLIKNPKVGENVYAIGNPGSLENFGTITSGIVSGVDVDAYSKSSTFENADFAIQIDTALNHGNSGGPLFNERGEVIGINTFKAERVDGKIYEGINFALPIQDALLIADKIRTEGKFVRASIGFNKYIPTKELTIYEKDYLKLDRHFSKGVLVKEFGVNNILNIPIYSIVSEVNGVEINSLAEFRRQLYLAGPNTIVKITYYEHKENGFDFTKKQIEVKTIPVNA